MVEIIKKILFKSVLIIILLHALIPHKHSDEMSKEEHFEFHQDNVGFINILKIFFHESDDENLDNLYFVQYNLDKPQQNKSTLNFVTVEDNTSFKRDKPSIPLRDDKGALLKNFIIEINRQRGPPTFYSS
ncbi:MAG: hypothetical protein L3J45_07335 [Flavobacteriaceae bacterium]|nr:hypothetical protein [Flavobacteriaceae bacterium]